MADITADKVNGRIDTAIELVSKKSPLAFGFAVRWIVLAALGWYSYTMIPRIADVPLAQLTLRDLSAALFWTIGMFGAIFWALRSGQKSYRAWAYFGFYGLAAIAILRRFKIL